MSCGPGDPEILRWNANDSLGRYTLQYHVVHPSARHFSLLESRTIKSNRFFAAEVSSPPSTSSPPSCSASLILFARVAWVFVGFWTRDHVQNQLNSSNLGVMPPLTDSRPNRLSLPASFVSSVEFASRPLHTGARVVAFAPFLLGRLPFPLTLSLAFSVVVLVLCHPDVGVFPRC